MYFSHLSIRHLRNISDAQFDFSPQCNFIIGDNGSGKTSLLEALHLIGLGRSFRSHLKSRLIQHQQASLTVFAKLDSGECIQTAGVEKSLKGDSKYRLDGDDISSIVELARLLPLQLLNPDSYQLIDSGPKYRRQFLDWGVFHVEHNYFLLWNKAQRLLKQRNAAIRQGGMMADVGCWDAAFVTVSVAIDQMRRQYFSAFSAIFTQVVKEITPLSDIQLSYYAGWNEEIGLAEQLKQRLAQDCQLGYTVNGPQRADLRVKYQQAPAQDILSRGQQKLLVCALRLTQAKLYQQQLGKPCIFLIDDLPSELDETRRDTMLNYFYQHAGQCFITSVDERLLRLPENREYRMFHVEQCLSVSRNDS